MSKQSLALSSLDRVGYAKGAYALLLRVMAVNPCLILDCLPDTQEILRCNNVSPEDFEETLAKLRENNENGKRAWAIFLARFNEQETAIQTYLYGKKDRNSKEREQALTFCGETGFSLLRQASPFSNCQCCVWQRPLRGALQPLSPANLVARIVSERKAISPGDSVFVAIYPNGDTEIFGLSQ